MAEQEGIRVSVSVERKVNLGNYESVGIFTSLSNVPVGSTEDDILEALSTGDDVYQAIRKQIVAQTKTIRGE